MIRAPVAVELSDKFLKLVALRPFGKQHQLTDCVVEAVAGLTDKQISELISYTLHNLKIKPHPLVVSIPRNFVTVRNLHLPSQDKNEISQMLQLHISRIVPYRKEEIVFNYSLAGHDDINYSKVVLAIVHKEVIKRHLNIMHSADLFIDRINLSSCGAWGWTMSSLKPEITASDIYLTLDVDYNYTDFVVFDRERILFTRSIALEMSEIPESSQVVKLTGEVKQSLVMFHNEEVNKNPAKIFLSGAPLIYDLEKQMRGEFDFPLKSIGLPYSQAAQEAKKRPVPANISLSAVADLIMNDFDKRISFTVPEIQIHKNLNERTRELNILGALVLYLFSVMLLFFWGRYYQQQSYLNRINQENGRIDKDMGGLLEQYKRSDFVKSFLYHRKIPTVFIYELMKITPLHIAIDYIGIDDANIVVLRGHGQQLSDVFKYISTIENSKYFKDVATKYTRTKKIKEKEVTDFEVTLNPEIPTENLNK